MEVRFLNLEYFFNLIAELFNSARDPFSGAYSWGSGLLNFIQIFFKVLLPLFIVGLFIAWIYYHMRVIELRRIDQERMYERLTKKQTQVHNKKRNDRWEQIDTLFNSEHQGDWRLAIIEADGMLEDLIVRLGYSGENLGERLKNIQNGDFPDLQAAWEVHLVRNKIAHEGLAYHLAERDKRHIHNTYRRIFTNAGFI